MSSSTILVDIFWVAVIIAINAVFVAAEFAIVRSHPTRLRSAELKRKYGVRSSLKLLEDLDGSLSTTQLGITVASLILGWWGEHTFQRIFFEFFSFFGDPARHISSHIVATTAALTLVTFLHVVLGELCAKSIAIRHPETTLRIVAFPLLLFAYTFRPMVRVLTTCATGFLGLFGIRSAPEAERVHTTAELAILVSQSTEKGILDKDEEQMLHGVFTFSDTVAREVMTPRADMVVIPAESTFDEVVAIITQSRFSRYPVVGDTVDNILGILMIRDLLPHVNTVRITGDVAAFDVRKIMREPFFVPDTKKIDDLLNEFKKRKVHLAIVVDEHGGVDGIVTLEDLLEEIVGDIFDESDVPEKDVVVEKDGNIVVDGGVLVSDINSRFELSIPEGDYDTIAGFIYTSLGRIPRVGDQIFIRGSAATPVNGGDVSGILQRAEQEQREVDRGGMRSLGAVSDGEESPKALITVEHVKGRRVERVRLRSLTAKKSVESSNALESSDSKKNVL